MASAGLDCQIRGTAARSKFKPADLEAFYPTAIDSPIAIDISEIPENELAVRYQTQRMERDETASLSFNILAVLVACFGIYVTWWAARGNRTVKHHRYITHTNAEYSPIQEMATAIYSSAPYPQSPATVSTKDRHHVCGRVPGTNLAEQPISHGYRYGV
jgi:hypothetical protein